MILGRLARVGPNHLVTDDPKIIRHMSNVKSDFTRGSWYDAMRVGPIDNVLSERNTDTHEELRKKMARGVCSHPPSPTPNPFQFPQYST